jgi:hypothetical protein
VRTISAATSNSRPMHDVASPGVNATQSKLILAVVSFRSERFNLALTDEWRG